MVFATPTWLVLVVRGHLSACPTSGPTAALPETHAGSPVQSPTEAATISHPPLAATLLLQLDLSMTITNWKLY